MNETPRGDADDRVNRARERMSADYDDAGPTRRRGERSSGGGLLSGLTASLGSDATTRRMIYGAVGLGVVLLIAVGGWSLLGTRVSGIPVLGPPPGPVRDKPKDPGGMQIYGSQLAQGGDQNGQAHLAPGPEQPSPEAFARQMKHDVPAETSPAPPEPKPEAAAPAAVTPAAPVPTAPAPARSAPASAPAPASPAPASPAAPAPTETAQTASAPEPAPPAAGTFGVQLAALASDAAAHAEWDRITKTAPTLFAGRSPVVERVEHGGSVFFRLRTRGFASIAEATSFCIHARAQGVACTLARF